MPLYEHVIISRPSLSPVQVKSLVTELTDSMCANGGNVVGDEYWGLKTLAYRIKRNRKAHYTFLQTDSPAAAVQEMDRLMRLHEDVIRSLTIQVETHNPLPTVQMAMAERAQTDSNNKTKDDESTPQEGVDAGADVDTGAGDALEGAAAPAVETAETKTTAETETTLNKPNETETT